MGKVRVANFTVSIDGFSSGLDQRMDEPFGDNSEGLHAWYESAMEERDSGRGGPGADQLRRFHDRAGATIMGRNMFSPHRGPWADESWTGWWGDNPPYHHDTFVLTHHDRPSVTMEGGTTFHFTSEPIDVVLDRAKAAAGDQDIIIGGGASTVRQYLLAGLIDELDLGVSPILIGQGERLLTDDVAAALREFRVVKSYPIGNATFYNLSRS
ncbi:dihydrofolate reductase family protein [Kribbella albertanoniae]|uniref:Dihydrofolate reductase n=1 Tax=Kribbella albertanoniae TaxID=1266829 RepID=A0A4V2XRI6_9ACTN|nr:dihydrofolate reductase family protein [Kribbella albertanoniae]TDC30015.1 dihydrofolate reductase [Kribbella albertanoniae]